MHSQGVIASGHPETTAAARLILEAGGNAFDALIAGTFASWVAEPVLSSPAGGGFILLRETDSTLQLYDGFAQTPRHRSPEPHLYPVEADFGPTHQTFFLGPATVATPGLVAALAALHRQHARLPLPVLAEPAIQLAREGLTISRDAARLFQVVRALYLRTPESRALFSRPSAPSEILRENDRFHNPRLADFLAELAAEGPRFFYEGEIAAKLDETVSQRGGHLSREDLAHYPLVQREPLQYHFAGHQLATNPAPSIGALFIQAGLQALSDTAAPRPAPGSPAEASLLVRLQQALHTHFDLFLQSPTLPGPAHAIWETLRRTLQAHPPSIQGTTHLSILDGAGRVAAFTLSNGSGSGIVLPSAGFMWNNMLGETDLFDRRAPAGLAWRTNVRLSSMMAPTLAVAPDGACLVTGSGGSKRIRTTLLQVLWRTLGLGLPPEEAVRAPRVHADEEAVNAEITWGDEVLARLDKLHGPIHRHPAENLFFGGAHTVWNNARGHLGGLGDPRRGGTAVIVSG